MEDNIKKQDNGIEPIPIKRNNATSYEKNKESYERAKSESVKKTTIDYKPKKKKITTKFFACSLAVLLTFTTYIPYLAKNIHKQYIKYNVDNDIVYMIAPNSNYSNIIAYITYIIKDGKGTHAYDTDKLARQMVDLDVKYIDLVIYNAYDNMQYNRTMNMNNLIKSLSIYTYGLESINPEVYYKLNGLNSFEEYLKDIGCVDENGEISLEKYNEYGKSLYNLHEEALKNTEGRKTK